MANSFVAFFSLLIAKGVVFILNRLGVSRHAQAGSALVLKAQVLSGGPSPGKGRRVCDLPPVPTPVPGAPGWRAMRGAGEERGLGGQPESQFFFFLCTMHKDEETGLDAGGRQPPLTLGLMRPHGCPCPSHIIHEKTDILRDEITPRCPPGPAGGGI